MIFRTITTAAAILFLSACNLTKEVEIDLPDYDSQPVVECYIEPGKVPIMFLSKSANFFAPFDTSFSQFLQNIVLQGATAVIEHNGNVDTLYNIPTFDAENQRFYNYTGSQIIPYAPGDVFNLSITLPDGKIITASTKMMSLVPVDSLVVEWNPTPTTDTLARLLTYVTDDTTTDDFYRRMFNVGTLDSIEQDFSLTDRFSATPKIVFGSGYDFEEGDTLLSAFFHITEPYYDYLESVQNAFRANLNPFAQPSAIKSNVSGNANALGIFAALVYDRDTIIVQK